MGRLWFGSQGYRAPIGRRGKIPFKRKQRHGRQSLPPPVKEVIPHGALPPNIRRQDEASHRPAGRD